MNSFGINFSDDSFNTRSINFKGGGGSTGEVSFPAYMEDTHQEWLGYDAGPGAVTTDLTSIINTATTTNPLESLSYDDPATDIAEWESEYEAWNTLVDGLDEGDIWDDIVSGAVSLTDTAGVLNDVDMSTITEAVRLSGGNNIVEAVRSALVAVDSQLLINAVREFRRIRDKERAASMTKYKSGMAKTGAVRSSAYSLGLALLEIDFDRQDSQYQTELALKTYEQGLSLFAQTIATEITARARVALANKEIRDRFVLEGATRQYAFKQFIVEAKKQLATVLAELHKTKFGMDSEYVGNSADLNWKYASWDLNVYSNAVGILGGIGGGQFVPEGPTKASSAIGGALGGAATGAMVGGPIGAGVGLLLGGLAGAL